MLLRARDWDESVSTQLLGVRSSPDGSPQGTGIPVRVLTEPLCRLGGPGGWAHVSSLEEARGLLLALQAVA